MKFRLVETLLTEGTWSLPFNESSINKLEILLSSPVDRETAKDELYDIYGDDQLFDKLDNTDESDVRDIIKEEIRVLLNNYNKHPNNFEDKCSKEQLKRLEDICK